MWKLPRVWRGSFEGPWWWRRRVLRACYGIYLALGIVACCAPCSLEAQPDNPRRQIANIPFVTAYGIGGFEVGDASVKAISLPVSVPVRRFGLDRWGLRVRLTGSLGFYDLGALEDLGLDQIRTFALLPGIEFQLPISRQVVLRPYVDVGGGKDLERHSAAFLMHAGVRSEFEFPWKAATVGIVPRLEYAMSRSSDDALDTDYAGGSFKSDVRYPLWFRLGTAQPDIGVYFRAGYYLKAVDFELREDDPTSIATEFEIGITTGSCPNLKLWILPLPRVSIGYRWTIGGVNGVRISLGDRVLRCGRQNSENL